MVPTEKIFTSQGGGTTLQMPALPRQRRCLSLIKMCSTIICLNGIVARKRALFIYIFSSLKFFSILTFFPSPRNPKELFNLRHASARNVIERIFGILKQRFRILQLPPKYDMSTQALIPTALAALHNFIREYDPKDIYLYDEEGEDHMSVDDDDQLLDLRMGPRPESVGEVMPVETAQANERRDKIASDMWEQYQHYLAGHEMDIE